MTRMTKTARTALALALATMLVVPATAALAAPRALGSRTTTGTAVAASGSGPAATGQGAQLGEILRERVRTALHLRKGRFDSAAAAIERRIVRIADLADRTEAAGADVSHVRELLDSARQAIEEAKTLEGEAVDEFTAVPDSSEPRAAFGEARGTAHDALVKLREARTYLRDANRELRDIVKTLLDSAEDA